MKAHVGVDSKLKQMHSAVATAANVHGSQVLSDLLHGEETTIWGDSANTGQGETIRRHAPQVRDFSQRKAHRHHPLSDEERVRNRKKSKIRVKGEHSFLILKKIFGFTKIGYRGLQKNANRCSLPVVCSTCT